MEGVESILAILALFVLRLGLPLVITLLIGYGLSRLDARWQAEADAAREARDHAEAGKRPQQEQARRVPPASPPGRVVPAGQPLAARDLVGLPCWSLKGCSEAIKATCAACHQPDKPCWQARAGAEGRLPSECKNCDLYMPQMPLWMGQEKVH